MNEKPHYHHGDLRSTLIENAIATIESSGVEAVNLRALAREIGVSHAAPMRHFATRANLLTAIAEEGITSLLERAIQQVADPSLTSLQKLRTTAEGYVAWARTHPAYHLILRNQDVMRHIDEATLEKAKAYARLQTNMIVSAQAQGWRPEETPRFILIQLAAITAGLALISSDPIYCSTLEGWPDTEDASRVLDRFFA